MASKKATPATTTDGPRLYTLEVALVGGPVTESFAEKNPVVSRTIEIRGNQTLADLHAIIFKAFDREEEHMYEFQVGGKGPMDPKAKRYVLDSVDLDKPSAGKVGGVTLDALKLKEGDAFGYWFDFGDDWWHQINVKVIGTPEPRKKYPRITERVGKSPPQYPDWDEEE